MGCKESHACENNKLQNFNQKMEGEKKNSIQDWYQCKLEL